MSETKIEPKCTFENLDEAHHYLTEWQKRLFLDDWLVTVEIDVPKSKMHEHANAEVAICLVNKTAKIKICGKEEYDKENPKKYCAEALLVHELVHLCLDDCDIEGDVVYTIAVFDIMRHAKVEQMAKSLIMAKYGIDFSWFRNF